MDIHSGTDTAVKNILHTVKQASRYERLVVSFVGLPSGTDAHNPCVEGITEDGMEPRPSDASSGAISQSPRESSSTSVGMLH